MISNKKIVTTLLLKMLGHNGDFIVSFSSAKKLAQAHCDSCDV